MAKKNDTSDLEDALAKIERVITGRTYLGGKETQMAFDWRSKGQHRLADAETLAREIHTFADEQLAVIERSRSGLVASQALRDAESEAEELRVRQARERHRAEQEAILQARGVIARAVEEQIG